MQEEGGDRVVGGVVGRVRQQHLGAAAVAVDGLGGGAAERGAGRLWLRDGSGGGVIVAERIVVTLSPKVGRVRRGASWNESGVQSEIVG